MLSGRERERYRRQLLLFGEEGQERLKRARVFIAGAGGLGSPIAIYLAAAGIGHIRLVDSDVVERTNLNRQILHGEIDIGRPKVQSAGEKLERINPDIEVEVIQETLDAGNVRELVGDAAAIVDAMDNYAARYLLNRTALDLGIPFFHGAIRGFDGQATTILPGRTACLACIFPRPPPADVFPVVGTAPGIIGLVQANEVLKYFLNTGSLLENRLLLWNGMASVMEEVAVERNPSCAECAAVISAHGAK
ncbi:MAG: HesA/MoeB/ThiF family protein [Methanomicrobiales archaeon]|nr:HesA/MoeB/ThiF family protein [Methanomicrobiales archaeon]